MDEPTGRMQGHPKDDTRLSRLLREIAIAPFASAGSTVAYLVIFWNTVPGVVLVSWVVITQAVNLLGAVFILYFRRHPNTPPSTWAPLFFTYSVADGLVWGSAIWLFLDPSDVYRTMLLIATTLGVAAGGQMTRINHRPSFTAFNVVIIASMALYFLSLSTMFGYVMAGLSLIFGGVLYSVAHRTHSLIEDNLILNQNLALANAELGNRVTTLTEDKDGAEKLAQILEQRVMERTRELQDSEERFRDFANASSDWFWETGPDLRYTYCSQHITKAIGISPDAMIGKTREEFGKPRVGDEEWNQHLTTLNNRKPYKNFEYEYQKSDGTTVYIQVSGVPVFGDDGDFRGYRGTGADVTKQKLAEEALRKSEEKYRGIFDESVAAVYLFDNEKNFIDSNQAGLDLLGFSRQELLSMVISDVDADPLAVQSAHEDLLSGDRIINFEHRLKHKDGNIITVLNNSKPLTDSQGDIIGMESTLINITERKKSEKALQKVEREYRDIFENATEGIYRSELNGQQTRANPALVKLNGYDSESELLAAVKNIATEWYVDQDRRAQFKQMINDHGRVNNFESEVYRHKTRERIWVSENAHAIYDAGGRVIGYEGTVTDITQRKQLEEKFHQSRELFTRAFHSNPSLIAISEPVTGKHVDVNEAWQNTLQFTREEAIGKTAFKMGIWADIDERKCILKELAENGRVRNFITQLKAKDGTLIDCSISTEPIQMDDQELVLWSATNITELKKRETQLRENEKRFRDFTDAASDWFWEMGPDLRFTSFSPQFEIGTGLSRDKLIGATRREQGRSEIDDEKWRRHLDDLNAHKPFKDFEYGLKRKDETVVYVRASGVPVFGDDGEFLGYRGTGTNITERKALEEQLRHAQKMEAVGQLTGGIAHDFNNLLGVMIGNAEMLEGRIGEDEKARHNVEALIKAVDRASSLTNRLLAFSRQQTLSPQPTEICHVIGGLGEMLHRTLGETIELHADLVSMTCEALIDQHQFENALINLAINARDAMPNGGVLTIEIARVTLDDAYARQHEEVTPGDYIKVMVSDTGTGMSPEVLENVFEPFFTTKEVGKGSGLGLSMVYGFVKQSNGHITIDSEVGHSTTVSLYVPTTTESAIQEDTEGGASEFLPGFERILVVEDDEDLRDIPISILRDQNYEVIGVRDGKEAIKLLKDADPFDLLFTDVVLPGGMNGLEIAEVAKRIQPNIKVLYVTGYAENVFAHSDTPTLGEKLLNKPYHRHELLEKVRATLDGRDV